MAEAAKRPKRARTRKWQGRIAVVLFTLFPLGVLAGLLSPGVIAVQLEQVAEAVSSEDPKQLDFQGVNLGHSPLLVPRDFSAGSTPELLDLDQLFRDTEVDLDTSGERLARLLAFPRSHGDAIVVDDMSGSPLDLLFDDALVGDTIAQIPGDLGGAFGLGAIGTPNPLGNRVRFDDFPGTSNGGGAGQPVPEPSAGLLFAVGLAGLGIRRRR
jgi:hypothetical protein